ncbi:sulfide/dihydroorotate dehydrogenase-like FAD/NAD-binding protein [Ruminococcus albus]|uniref:Oxidoreductase FAD/NAD(P)-binding domain protein n=1 Tax=Ruminococcus albus (strain ATCC 27210 / DSM 20455 / JCM 14654 / NCDO 2250 / 7) TaxID=697329 RepID=E6UAV2_RUMA7|nr:sulfide/dihydroorotate dehydrogenase-like FAD/NAD-binding protein [Ruminococcus albus]ADU22498.1 oxidoreductase FAD/NAD(P)-binding domain protein [Ruminococcus albus 7 = DSM 20455]
MFKILRRKQLNDTVVLMDIEAPFIAKKADAGQFVIVRADEYSERIPLTIADFDREKGVVTIIFQTIGGSTMSLAALDQGEEIRDVVGPLGVATEYDADIKKVAVIGGGVGCAIAYPQAKKLHRMGVDVQLIAGFRSKDIIILEDEMKAESTDLHICTDDGSYGYHGFVTDKLKELIESGADFDEVIAIGPVPMMKFICKVTEPYNIKTIVSLNPIMIDGTGMCGGCRVRVGGEIKYACVDGPDFDGHKVDFNELIRRNSTYNEAEKQHVCRLMGGAVNG